MWCSSEFSVEFSAEFSAEFSDGKDFGVTDQGVVALALRELPSCCRRRRSIFWFASIPFITMIVATLVGLIYNKK